MKKRYFLLWISLLTFLRLPAQDQLNCDFTVAAVACVNQQVKVLYTGGASANASYIWNFDGAVVISGSGQGPYYVKWETPGERHIILTINWEGQTCTATRVINVIEQPQLFAMTGGGVLVPGSPGVGVGLNGSQIGIVYKLRRNGEFTGVYIVGNGLPVTFGLQTLAGSYTALARVEGSDCLREMEGVAVITSPLPPVDQNICMVTFDTIFGRNKLIWNKMEGQNLSHVNIYREIYQQNVFHKIGEVPYDSLSVFVDPVADPLIKSDRYKLSVTDSAGLESEKSPAHKTIHLNINPGPTGFNLIWNHYEGFEFKTYRIHRKHDGGPWEIIDSIASNVDSYTDFYSMPGLTTYFIEVVRPEPCHPTLKSGIYSGVLSNMAAAAPLGSDEHDRSGILAFPNPASEKINLVLPGNETYLATILRIDGVEMITAEVIGPAATINVSGLAGGLYLLKLTGTHGSVTRKIIKH